MADFSSVTKYLQLTPATVDSERNTKPLTITKTRAIGLLEKQTTLVAHEETGESHTAPSIRFQYNIDAGANCRISNFKQLRNYAIPRYQLRSFLCVRYRVGSDVIRYHLDSGNAVRYPLSAPLYEGEVLPRYFVIEVWSYFGTTWGLPEDINLNLALLEVPTSPNDIDYETSTVPELVASELLITMPAALPIAVDAAGPYESN